MNERAQQLSQQAFDRLIVTVNAGYSNALSSFLQTMSRFHQYSWHNTVLIHFQKPDATKVAGFRKWLELGRHVKTGEKGIVILAPIVRHAPKRPKYEPIQIDEEARIEQQLAQGFTTAYVFDISQTGGRELPSIDKVKGNPDKYLGRLQQLAQAEGINLRYVSDLGGAEGRSKGGEVLVLDSLCDARKFSVLSHELAHEIMHQRNRKARLDKRIKECEAESVAYVVASAIGLDCGTSAADYVHLYGGDSDLLLKSMGRIKHTSTDILRAILDKS